MLSIPQEGGQLLISIDDKRPSRTGPRRSGRMQPNRRTAEMEAYCLKCRTQREMSNAEATTMKNGKPATKGKCPVCGTTMFKIGKAK